MAAIKTRSFGGIVPKLNPRYLAEDKAQTALDVDTSRSGALTPLRDVGPKVRTLGYAAKTLYRYKEDIPLPDSDWWIGSKNDANFCKGQIVEDASEVLYFTDNDRAGTTVGNTVIKPQFVYDALVLQAGINATAFNGTVSGVSSSLDLGTPAPELAPTVEVGALTEEETDGLTREFRTYVFTYVWTKAGREMESAPSPAPDAVGYFLPGGEEGDAPGATVTIDTLVAGVPDPKMEVGDVKKRLYRAVAGGFFFIDEIPVTQQTYEDNVAPDDLGEEIPSLTWGEPPPAMKGIVNMSNGIIAGFDGRTIYFCEPYIPHAWPIAYSVSVESPIVGLASLDTTLVVLTRERPYYVQGSHPSYMTVVEGGANQGCVSKRSIATMNGDAYFMSPDGLCKTSPRGTSLITEQIFSYRQWTDLIAPDSNYHAYTHDQKYIAFGSQSFIYDLPTASFTTTSAAANAGYVDERLDKLYAVSTTKIEPWAEGDNHEAHWKSKVFSMPREVSFSFMQVEAEDYPVTINVYTDNALLLNKVVADRRIFRLPSILARDWEIEIFTSHEVFNVALGQAGEEMAGV